ncbi:hypothetical protein BX600DRAFT_518521 [Xylariales sp. PMI_506]|nr:hypothetical protein BX600DRAFT_518521 [Xylariales sp. PMI_506]
MELPLWKRNSEAGARRRRLVISIITTVILLLVVGLWRHTTLDSASIIFYQKHTFSPREAAANSTLGFEKLIALSPAPSWRTRGLHSAAQLTGLDFTIPAQPAISDEFVHAFQKIGADEGKKTPHFGSAKAWLAHLDLLKYVITSEVETAFIVEDDVDWDLRLKGQMQLISDNVRDYTAVPDEDGAPYGTNWDILWLGHCGSAIEDFMPPPRVFPDESRCETDLYSGWSKHYLREKLPEGHRQVQGSYVTVCTFGYGVTKAGARKALELLSQGGDEAFDVSLSAQCRSGALKCLVVNPQVFNHYEPPAQQGYTSDVHVGDGRGTSTDEANFETVKGTTGNIKQSARCSALFHDTCMRPPSEI